jgi:hypothetical protein
MSTVAAAKAGIEPPSRPQSVGLWAALKRIIKPVASLRLTVALLALSVVLVFVGTIAQVDDSIHTVLNKYFYTWIAWVPFDIFVRFGQKFLGVSKEFHLGGSFPFPGGWTLGFALMVNLLSAHALRFKYNLSRPGVWVLHGGVVILLLGEFISSQCKIESRMTIAEGTTSNYVENDHDSELAIVDSSDPKEDQVAVVPDRFLRRGGRISNPALPVDIEVLKFMETSTLLDKPIDDNPATTGLGLMAGAVARKQVPGISTAQIPDVPAAYVRFLDRNGGKVIGTYLVTPWVSKSQLLPVGDKNYSVALRPRRKYLPFSLHLNEFRYDRFIGTSVARNYSSDVRLIDPELHVDRQLRISMNEPLRYRGETFYQADFDHETEKATILQVVRNPVWAAPYFACGLVAVGMAIHFGMHLNKFIAKRTAS